jgi:hypothetical protein
LFSFLTKPFLPLRFFAAVQMRMQFLLVAPNKGKSVVTKTENRRTLQITLDGKKSKVVKNSGKKKPTADREKKILVPLDLDL